MNKKKFLLLIEDDCEVMGNGLGNVMEHQFLPSLMMMELAQRYNVKMTFMVDVAHQLTLRRHLDDTKLRIQSELWDDMVLLMKSMEFDVQLHLHPQWVGSKYKDGNFFLDSNWNVGRCDYQTQRTLITQAVAYLQDLIRPTFPDYSVHSFKAGSWGMQPSAGLLELFSEVGISILMGPRDGMVLPHWGVNYESLEEKDLPYQPDSEDITKISKTKSPFCVLPLQVYEPNLVTLSRLVLNEVSRRVFGVNELRYLHKNPIHEDIVNLGKGSFRNFLKPSIKPYRTHLKIGSQSFSFMKDSFDSVIKRLDVYDVPRIPVVIESHTKQYRNNFAEIEKFLYYVNDKYSDSVEFGDMTMLADEIFKQEICIVGESE